jgi:hypothetical protein
MHVPPALQCSARALWPCSAWLHACCWLMLRWQVLRWQVASACGAAFAVGRAAFMARAGYRGTAIIALFGAASRFADSKRAASSPPPVSVAAARSMNRITCRSWKA